MGAGGARPPRGFDASFALGLSKGRRLESGHEGSYGDWDWLAGGVTLLIDRRGPLERAGLAEDPRRFGKVEELELEESAREASDSTSSIEWPCHPWFTLTMA